MNAGGKPTFSEVTEHITDLLDGTTQLQRTGRGDNRPNNVCVSVCECACECV